ncbi:MAG: MinD/ParA family protein [Bdellovibrionales bacterium]
MNNPIPFRTHKMQASPVAALRCPNMLAVASGKGGVGKTLVSITLCHALARSKKNVLLFDGDLGLANVDIQLGLTPEKDLANVTEGAITLKDAVTHYKDGNFDILAGRSGAGNLATMSAGRLVEIRSSLIELAPSYDYVIVDLGAGVDRPVRQMAGPAATTYVVLTDEPTSLTDAYAFIKLSLAANPKASIQIIVNQATSQKEGQATYDTIAKACQTFLQTTPPLAGIIRRDIKVREAIRMQTPLLIRSPLCEAAQDIEAIAASVMRG